MMEFVYPHTHLVAGVDEVGRGQFGAVVTAAVILDPAKPIVGLNDSKKLRSVVWRCSMRLKRKRCAGARGARRAARNRRAEYSACHYAGDASAPSPARALFLKFVPIDGNRCPSLPMPSRAVVKATAGVAENQHSVYSGKSHS